MYFPEKGWKVRVVDFDGENVKYETWEYNGRLTDPFERDIVTKSLEDFLYMYYQ